MKKSEKPKKNRKRGGLVTKALILALLVALGAQLWALSGKVKSAKAQEAELRSQVTELQAKNDSLSSDLAHADDPELIAKIARDRLGMVAAGERVFYDVSN